MQTFVKAMKLTAIILLALCMQVSATGVSQQVTLSQRNVSLDKIFTEIQKQTGYTFVYRDEWLQKTNSVSIHVKNVSVREALDICFRFQPFTYALVDRTVVLKLKDERLVSTAIAEPPPPINVTGTVTDEAGNAVSGVSVVVKGTTKGTTTNEGGVFTLNGVDDNAILVISGANIERMELPVNGRNQLSISVKKSVSMLDATVVKGYYSTTKRSSTGSVSTISAETIGNQPVIDPIAAMQGRVPGLMISSWNGLPGSGFQVRIRGENSISSGNNPLYIVDGVPFISTPLNMFSGANGDQSPLSAINPADIARIDVLKDADATAIYGSRGANGVVLITTKQGKAGAGSVTFNIYKGISKVANKLKMLNTQQYLELRNEGFANDGATKTVTNAPDLLIWDQNAYTDWQDLLIGNTANVTDAQVSFSGGSAQTRYLFSAGLRKEGTVLLGDFGYTRGSSNLSVDHSSKNGKFGLGVNFVLSTDKNDIVPTDVSQYFSLPPNYPAYNPDGSLYWYGSTQNPVAYLNRTYETKTNNMIANANLRYSIIPGLTVRTNLGYTITSMKQLQTLPQSGFSTINPPASQAQYAWSDVNSYIVEPQIDYTTQLGIGKLSLLAGGTWQQSISEGTYYFASGFSSDALLKNMAAASNRTLRDYRYTEYRYQALFGRINYDIDSKYILNLTFRKDGSSRFVEGRKYGNFGAAGIAWVFSEENSIKNTLPFLSYGKFRASYGVTGNDQLADYAYLDTWDNTSFPYGGITGLAPSSAFNADFSWETNRKLDLALELGFIQNRIMLTTNYYDNRSDNQLVGQTLSPQAGFSEYQANFPALVQNKGWEFDLTSNNIKTTNFSWNTSFNLSLPTNKLLKYEGLEKSADASAYVVGQSTRIIKGYKFTGIDKDTGIPQFLDVNNDNGLDEANDWVVLGQTLPKFFGGLSNDLRYKRFSLDIFFQFVKQEAPTVDWGPLAGAYGGMSNKTEVVLGRWRKPGDIVSVPRATVTSSNPANTAFRNYYRTSSAVWGDASYIRLKNVMLRYDLSDFTKRWKINNSSIFFQGQNLFTITNYNGLDPEINGFDRRFVFPINPFGSVRTPAMPILRTFTVGLGFTL